MIDADTTLWPHQAFALAEVPRRIAAGERRICLTAPTGGGKSRIVCHLIDQAVSQGWECVLYTNRKLLIDQLSTVLDKHGIEFGVRASGHEDNRHLPVQISSLPTENQRVLKTEQWEIHGRSEKTLAIVDECHLNKAGTAQTILNRHHQAGGVILGVTATPIDLGHLYDTLVVAGTPTELRKCGALVPAYHFGPDEPDMKGFKANVKTGEYSENDIRKAVMTKCVFARVLEWYGKTNPERRPTILFGPGVAESIWFAERLTEAGIRAAHIDGEGVWLDGQYNRGADRGQVLADVRAGLIEVLCNRFVLREGLDLPEVSHIILGTVMALQSFLQSVGRGLRACAGKDRLTIQDHGGHWWRHGSVNIDREWRLTDTETIIRGTREDRLREHKDPEPIHCPNCGQIRASGPRCLNCGAENNIRSRMVVQVDGSLKEHVGDIFKPRRVAMRNNTLDLWKSCYYRARKSKNRMNFRQAEGLFVKENHYWPPHDLPFMPTDPADWHRPVAEVPADRLSR